MISLTKPTAEQLRRLNDGFANRPLSYDAGLLKLAHATPGLPGSIRAWLGDGWFIDRYAEVVGHGPADLDSAKEAVRTWKMFDQAWTEPVTPVVTVDVGNDVAYTARVLGVWWSYGCRILEVIDEPSRFGFVYGTIDGHAERGEELFQVALLANDDVEFSLVAMSRPGTWFAWPGLAFARRAQRRFRPGAADGIRRAVSLTRDEESIVR
jgi:uncharacterized protein (UPF0548 family)